MKNSKYLALGILVGYLGLYLYQLTYYQAQGQSRSFYDTAEEK